MCLLTESPRLCGGRGGEYTHTHSVHTHTHTDIHAHSQIHTHCHIHTYFPSRLLVCLSVCLTDCSICLPAHRSLSTEGGMSVTSLVGDELTFQPPGQAQSVCVGLSNRVQSSRVQAWPGPVFQDGTTSRTLTSSSAVVDLWRIPLNSLHGRTTLKDEMC